jgi:hypothetical protein
VEINGFTGSKNFSFLMREELIPKISVTYYLMVKYHKGGFKI